MLTLRADLHVHTVLSPCADVEMIPPLIVENVIEAGIGLIAITDHNATANIQAVQQAAIGRDLVVLPGMELQTVEEVHVLCLFDTLDQAYAMQSVVDGSLPDIMNNVEFFGEQFVIDETGDYLRREDRLLLTSTSLTFHKAWEHVQALGGLLIPAHINRKAYGLIQTLGLIPEDTPVEILEISTHITAQQVYQQYPQVRGYPLIQNGDAHFLEEIAGNNQLTLDSPTISEIRLAILGQAERHHVLLHS